MDTNFRSISNEPVAEPIPVPSGEGNPTLTDRVEALEPAQRGKTIFEALGVEDNLPEDELSNITELEGYVFDILKSKGVDATLPNIKREIDTLKGEMGLDEKASIDTVLDRVGGVIRAWKSLSFIKNSDDKRQLFLRLASAKSSKEMNEIVFKEMEERTVWQ